MNPSRPPVRPHALRTAPVSPASKHIASTPRVLELASAHGLAARPRRPVYNSLAVPPPRKTSPSPPAILAPLSTQSTAMQPKEDAVPPSPLRAALRPPSALYCCISAHLRHAPDSVYTG
ncbi:hypothetical protein MSAN_00527000 [Mycena sanguinolenta]|uniref:Uncharacterized protein n=1 Tax=Mycena sanguinolenta TaxID=230812 RepID=A0A8H6Z8Z0_9AGAR|nr:hypothetical protein MSAN_00527000 [Mycena sanguinolenta]